MNVQRAATVQQGLASRHHAQLALHHLQLHSNLPTSAPCARQDPIVLIMVSLSHQVLAMRDFTVLWAQSCPIRQKVQSAVHVLLASSAASERQIPIPVHLDLGERIFSANLWMTAIPVRLESSVQLLV